MVFSRTAEASFHLMKIVEVYQGGQQNSEFIELQRLVELQMEGSVG